MSQKHITMKFLSPKRLFYFPELSTKNICSLGLLIAITVVLSIISGYLRIGNISKLSISFVPVFIAAYAYGGIIGGVVAAIADIISCFINPVGPFMLQITMIEFVFGFIYGIFFYRLSCKFYTQNAALCSIIQFLSNIFIKTIILSLSYKNPFTILFIQRLPVCIIQMILIFAVLLLLKSFTKTIDKIK